MSSSGSRVSRYARNMALAGWGEAGQRRLRDASVVVVGAGGLGSAVLPLLVSQGVGGIRLYEYDRIEESNLPRQLLFTPHDVGQPKAGCAAERLKAMNPELRLEVREERFDSGVSLRASGSVDLLVDCTDNFATRYAIDDVAAREGVAVVWGAVHDFVGQVSLLHGKARVSLRDIFGEPDGPVPLSAGVFAPLVQTVGAIMASECTHYLLGQPCPLDGQLLQLDMRDYSVLRFPIG